MMIFLGLEVGSIALYVLAAIQRHSIFSNEAGFKYLILGSVASVAILLGIGYHVLLNRSRFGYDLRLSGMNAEAARSAGVNPKRSAKRALA